MTKTEQIRLHLVENGTITSWEAIEKYRATRLSAIIYNLRYHYGMNISNERVNYKDSNGRGSHYDIYHYEGQIEE